jgi:UDP-N-acetylmuramyl pentapeptide phosphotransferase/UDP-N-acetylglucosamine-1-phosphate transferase
LLSGYKHLAGHDAKLYLIALLGFGLLGFIDDIFGSRNVGGFRGHFKKLLLEGKLTTGAAKALGGGIIAVYLAYQSSGGRIWMWALDTVVIALAANTINLLDLRPGRAIFMFFVGLLAAVIMAWGSLSAPITVAVIAAAAIFVAHYDRRGYAMLGDVGSNTLGAVLGLTLALDAPVAGKVALAVVFFAINLFSEKRSISELIEHNPVLTRIDSKLGVR